MIRKTRLYTPGPTPLLPAAQFAMAAADIHHRTAEFRALYTRVLAQLKDFVGTRNDVIILASSGTGAMEASVSNLTSPGDRVLVLSAGKFGERWTGITKAFGCEVDVVSAPYGGTFSLDAVKAALKLETRAVFVQATESSTGVRHDVQAIGQLLKDQKAEALLVVDAITGIGTTPKAVREIGRRYLDYGLEQALYDKARPGAAPVLEDRQRRHIIAMVCSDPPEGCARWTIRLVAEEAVKRRLVPRIGRESIRLLLLHDDLKPWREKNVVRPRTLTEDYIAKMEDVLETYERPYSPQEPVLCLDEKPITLHADVRPASPAEPGREARHDSEYKRCGTANVDRKSVV